MKHKQMECFDKLKYIDVLIDQFWFLKINDDNKTKDKYLVVDKDEKYIIFVLRLIEKLRKKINEQITKK